MRVDQILPIFAIGNHTLALREALRRWGHESDIFAQLTHPRLAKESRFFEDYRAVDAPGNVLLYHYSIGSPVTRFVAGLRARRVVDYHNITPPEFFEGVNRRAAAECRRGLRELPPLAGETALGLGDSEFNRRDLEGMGFAPTGVLPIFIPFEDYDREPDRRVMKAFGDGRPNVLHVGRFAPNKKIEDLVRAFAFLKKTRPDARLVLAGTDVNLENYSGAVRELVERLGVRDVVFVGHVTFPELLAYYRTAAVYLTMSEHEGFCVPLVEAMIAGVPVVAYASTAVPGTLGGGGILFDRKDYPEVAAIIEEVIGNDKLRSAIKEAARVRLTAFGKEARESALRAHLASLGV
jgi:glycosyltransferase involved in cell wall biosynthesis